MAFIACVLKKPDLEEEGDCSDELNNAIAAQDEVLETKGQEAVSGNYEIIMRMLGVKVFYI